jgi:hypothetical protein
MASFISFNSSAPEVSVDSPRDKKDIIDIDGMYKIMISNNSTDSPIQFSGYVPENFSIGLSSGWSAPFQGMSMFEVAQELTQSKLNPVGANGQRGSWVSSMVNGTGGKVANNLLKFAGYGSYSKLLSAQIWDAPGYLTLELPIFLDGFSDTMKDVVNPLVLALKMAAPAEKGSLLIPPGPSPAMEVSKSLVDMGLAAYQDATGKTGVDTSKIFDMKESFTVTVGNFFSMTPAIIEGVSMATENVMDAINGKPVSADVMISVKSYFAVTRQDLDKWFGIA